MAKAKRVRVKRAKKPKVRSMRTNRPVQPKRNMAQSLDKSVRDYIALLKDPCNGPLIGPVGATAQGYITRFETTLNITTDSNWYFRWAPGALSFTGTNNDGFIANRAATMGGALTGVYSNAQAPGYNYLNGTAQTYRCLAACAQVRYTGTEVNRAGVVGSTICTSIRTPLFVQEAMNLTVDRARVPDQSLEVLWQPGDGDEMFTSRQTAFLDDETRGRKNAILLAGQACTTGEVSIRFVVVYQWTPSNDDNIILPVPTPQTGANLATVLMYAKRAGFVAGHLIKGYVSGGLYGVAREAASMIKPGIRNMH